jgi:hemolysin activation/secretion protein
MRSLVRIAAAIALATCSAISLAQPRPDAGSILESTKPAPSDPRPSVDVLPRVQEPKPALGAPGLKVVVRGFRISGNTIYGSDVLLATIQEFVGKEQNIDGLNDAATKVRAYYRERGYFLAQAYLPQQEIKDGVVEIAVIEARVGTVALNMKPGTRYSEGLVRGIIEAHLKRGDIITENGLETPLLLLNDFPNAVVTSEIKPSQTVGAADLTIHVSDTPGWISGSVDMDNYGNRFTGAIRTGISLNVNNPLSMGDQLSYRAFRTDDEMSFYRVAYAVPVLYWGTRVGASYASFHYRLGKEGGAVGTAGNSFIDQQIHGVGGVSTLFAFHPLIRTRSSNVILQFAHERKRLGDRNEVARTITDQDIVSSKVGVTGDFRDGLLGGGLNSYSFTVTEGNAIFRGTIPDPTAVGRFAKYNYEFRRLQKITDNATLLLALAGQVASKNLTSAERFSLGGAAGVRSYPTGEALGDTGYVFQGELRYIIPGLKVAGGDVTVSGFYDQGWVRIQKDFVTPAGGLTAATVNNRNLSGYGVGGSLGRDSDFILRASVAFRNEREVPQSDATSRIPRVWVQGVKWF